MKTIKRCPICKTGDVRFIFHPSGPLYRGGRFAPSQQVWRHKDNPRKSCLAAIKQ